MNYMTRVVFRKICMNEILTEGKRDVTFFVYGVRLSLKYVLIYDLIVHVGNYFISSCLRLVLVDDFYIEKFIIYSTAWQRQKCHMLKLRLQKSPVLWPFLSPDTYARLGLNYMGPSGVLIVRIRNRYLLSALLLSE